MDTFMPSSSPSYTETEVNTCAAFLTVTYRATVGNNINNINNNNNNNNPSFLYSPFNNPNNSL